MNILIAPDKFKGSLSARKVCQAIASGLNHRQEGFDITFHPMADGGDGSLDILADHLAMKEEVVHTQDPLGRPIFAKYLSTTDAAFIEVASASGLVLLEESERNPLLTSTLGTGEMMLDAIAKGYQNIYLFLGGSATNDAGMGIAHALGFEFLDAQHNILQPIGAHLSKVAAIKKRRSFDFSKIKITLFCDVTNPLFGENGAAYVYAPQKGATTKQVKCLDKGLVHFSEIIGEQTAIDISQVSGIGTAGGIGVALVSLCGAQMERGFEAIARLTGLEEKIQHADRVISGEGKLDEQSLQGKVIDGVAKLCQKHQKYLTLFVGKNELTKEALLPLNIKDVFAIINVAKSPENAMSNAEFYLKALAQNYDLS